MEFREKCRIVEKCLPESPFKDQIVKLHDEMLDYIAALDSECNLLQQIINE